MAELRALERASTDDDDGATQTSAAILGAGASGAAFSAPGNLERSALSRLPAAVEPREVMR